ncbi:MAG: hypothetical protein RIC56_02355 [Pseudomonadales bacterium]
MARLRQSRHLGLSLALGAALLLRVLVPAGYMPAALADGWLLQLCPDGLPAATVQALLGPSHQHHEHHAPPHGAPNDLAAADDAIAVPDQCELGGFAMAAIVDAAGLADAAGPRRGDARGEPTHAPALHQRALFQARAPPPLLA